MNLTGKDKIDFIDAHLWAEQAKITISCQIKNIPNFFPILSDINMIAHAHTDDCDDPDYYLNLEFNPVVMTQGRTERKIKQLLAIAYAHGTVQISLDETSARVDAEGNVIESWANERQI